MDSLEIAVEILLLIAVSAICSGLNLSLMSLDISDLERKARAGNRKAERVLPLRRNNHLALASILLTNVAVIATVSLVLEHHFNGLIAGIASTLLIVIFGEIFPQAYFLKRSLPMTALFVPVLRFMIFVTYPVSKPLQILLDRLFGIEKTSLHSRRELGMIIAEHANHQASELDDDEVVIMSGALALSEKHVDSITTGIKHVFWLTPDSVIDARKIDEIQEQNWSRIPVLDNELTRCYGILLMKDLVDIDFDEKSYRIDELHLHKTKPVGSKTALDTLFRTFITTHTHLLPVERNEKIIGIVTIEDLLEEIIGHEIEDESDAHR